MVTTSWNPSDKLKKFHKEISSLFPNSSSINWGAYKIKDIYEIAKDKDFSDIIFVHEYKGIPNGLIISHLPIGPTIYIGLINVVMRHEV